MTVNSPLRAFVKMCFDANINPMVAWRVWKKIYPRATFSFFTAEWRDCASGHENYQFSI